MKSRQFFNCLRRLRPSSLPRIYFSFPAAVPRSPYPAYAWPGIPGHCPCYC